MKQFLNPFMTQRLNDNDQSQNKSPSESKQQDNTPSESKQQDNTPSESKQQDNKQGSKVENYTPPQQILKLQITNPYNLIQQKDQVGLRFSIQTNNIQKQTTVSQITQSSSTNQSVPTELNTNTVNKKIAPTKTFTKAERLRNKILDDFNHFSNQSTNIQFYLIKPPKEKDKIWAYFRGIKGQVHERGIYKCEFTIPENYPQKKPEGKFLSPIPCHPNISSSGQICLVNYYKDWEANIENRNFNGLMEAIGYLIDNPNFKDYFNSEVSDLYKKNEYNKKAKEQAEICRKAHAGN